MRGADGFKRPDADTTTTPPSLAQKKTLGIPCSIKRPLGHCTFNVRVVNKSRAGHGVTEWNEVPRQSGSGDRRGERHRRRHGAAAGGGGRPGGDRRRARRPRAGAGNSAGPGRHLPAHRRDQGGGGGGGRGRRRRHNGASGRGGEQRRDPGRGRAHRRAGHGGVRLHHGGEPARGGAGGEARGEGDEAAGAGWRRRHRVHGQHVGGHGRPGPARLHHRQERPARAGALRGVRAARLRRARQRGGARHGGHAAGGARLRHVPGHAGRLRRGGGAGAGGGAEPGQGAGADAGGGGGRHRIPGQRRRAVPDRAEPGGGRRQDHQPLHARPGRPLLHPEDAHSQGSRHQDPPSPLDLMSQAAWRQPGRLWS